jgi:cell division septation protein DedD
MADAIVRSAGAVALTAVLALCAGCSGEEKPARKPSSSPSSAPSPSKSSASSPSSPSAPSTTATAPKDTARATAQLTENWELLFSPNRSVKEKLAAVEDGETQALMIEAFAHDEGAKQLRSRIDGTSYDSATEAQVTYTLTRDGQVVRASDEGTAVRQDGTWKVSLRTMCALAEFGTDVPRSAECD